ncbi:MAG TPA: MoaD/ThiS family protein [Thermodesulfobacteriota bacterium]|nr:MoaD/ThiS family protein [Thermodesulfobacteriota bacterium]HNU70282.1 MoaD/ThiS family protein [Thermodesulfobacteriota bacterium]
MNVEVRMFMEFRKYLPSGASEGKLVMTLEEGTTVGDLLNKLGVPLAEQKILVINGVSHGACGSAIHNQPLKDGDVVALFPPVGGG